MKIDFEALGERMLKRKQQLLADGIPADAEHLMVENAAGRADSPASAARRKAKMASAFAARRETKKPASKSIASRKPAGSAGPARSRAEAGRRSR